MIVESIEFFYIVMMIADVKTYFVSDLFS